jgi:hypothetical protein
MYWQTLMIPPPMLVENVHEQVIRHAKPEGSLRPAGLFRTYS